MKTRFLLGLVAILMVFGCKDSFDDFTGDPLNPVDPPPVDMEFNASAFVTVIGTDGEPVEGAGITLGSFSTTTDEFGVAHLEDVEMRTNTYLAVDKVGYFHGSRMFYPAEDKTSYIRVMLLENAVIGSVEASQGGSINTTGLVLDFPENSVVDRNGNDYNGTVSVAASPLLADDPELSDKMPGDLMGRQDDGSTATLASMGMIAVELRGDNGDLLQVKDGSTVRMELDVPPSMVGKAPSTIPMWYFDETAGIWVEDGEGTLTGGKYVAELPHFTWWNCDAPFDLVKFGASFVFESGAPSTQLQVCFTILSMDSRRCGFTNDEGEVCGPIPKDEALLMEVLDPCGNVIYSQEIGPYSDSAFIGPITLPETSITLTTVSGNAIDCNGDPVSDGFVRLGISGGAYLIDLEDDGSFSAEVINCDESDVVVTVIDEANLKQSNPLTFAFDNVIDAGTITVCETITELVTITLEDPDTTYTFFLPIGRVDQGSTSISTQDSTVGGGIEAFQLWISGDEVGSYDEVELFFIIIDQNGTVTSTSGDASAEITYIGGTGDYIIGTFEGEVVTDPNGQGNPVPMTGTFSAIRQN